MGDDVALDSLFEELRSYYHTVFFQKKKKKEERSAAVELPKRFQWTMLKLIFNFEY